MLNSRVIEVDGIFLGAAIDLPAQEGWRFVAADTRVIDLNGHVADTLGETQRLARQALLAARFPHPLPVAVSPAHPENTITCLTASPSASRSNPAFTSSSVSR